MKSNFLKVLILVLTSYTSIIADHRIEIQIDNYQDTFIVIGYYYGQQTLVKDTLFKNTEGRFIMEGKDTLHSGVYLFLTLPDNKFVQFLINDNDQNFSIKTSFNSLDKVEFIGSVDNDLFYNYLEYLGEMRTKKQSLDSDNLMTEQVKSDEYSKLDQSVLNYQQNLINQYPSTITALLLKSNMQIDIPTFEGSGESIKLKNYLYFKDHYFDFIDLSNPSILFTPFLHEKITYYLDKLTIQVTDSLIKEIDLILNSFEPGSEGFKYYLSHFLNTYAKSKVVGFDAIYVHLVEFYYAKGFATWIDKESLDKIIDNAKRLKPILIGRTAPDFTVFKEDNSSVTLSKIESTYTILMFWAPDCGHCSKAMPDVIEFYNNYRGKGITLVAICNKTGSKYATCWDAVKEKGMEGFLNVGDAFQRSRIQSKYYVRTTPKIFILDKDKKILVKDIGSEQLGDVMDTIIANNDSLNDNSK